MPEETKPREQSKFSAAPGSDRLWLAGLALNGLLHSASYGGELQRIFDTDKAIWKAGHDRESPQEYTARIAISLADALLRQLEPNDQAQARPEQEKP